MKQRTIRLTFSLALGMALALGGVPSTATADGWSLTKDDKKKDKKPKKGKKKGKKTKKTGKKTKKKDPKKKDPGETKPDSPLNPALAHAAEYVEMLLVDPSDDWLIEHFVEETKNLDGGPAGSLVKIVEGLPKVGNHDAFSVVKARILLMSGGRQEAVELLEAEMAAHPGEPMTAYFLASALLADGKSEKALGLLVQALGWSSSGKTSFMKGRILEDVVEASVALGSIDESSTYFVELCKETGELSEHFEEILDLYAIEEDEDGAIEFIDDVLGSRSWSSYEKYFLNFVLAERLHDADRDAEALKPLKTAVSKFAGGGGECATLSDLVFAVAGEKAALKIVLKGKKSSCFTVNAAQHLESSGQIEEALAMLAKANKKFPKDLDVFMAYVDTLMRAGEVESTIEFLRTKAKAADADPLVVVKLAEVLFDTGSRKEAIEVLSKLGEKSKNPALHEVLEQFYDSVGEPLLAKKENEILVKLVPGDPEHLIRLGERIYSEGKITEAIELWMTIPDLYFDKSEGLLRLADVLLDHMAYVQAEDAYQKALDEKGDGYKVEAMRKMALYYDVINNTAEAEKWWSEILNSSDASFGTKREASVRLVQLWIRTYILDKKLPVAQKWVEAEPERIELGLLLANVYLELGSEEKCRTLLAGLLERIGGAVSVATPAEKSDLLDAADHVIVTLDRLNRLQKKWADAMETFEQASLIFPDKMPELKLKMAEYAVLAGRHDKARAAIDDALAAAPGDPDVNEDAAELLFRIGDIDRAADCLIVITAKDPSRYEVRLKLARALVHLEKWEKAAGRLTDLVEDCPYDYVASEGLSLLVAVVDSGNVDMDLEKWMYKLFMTGEDRDYAGRRLIEIYDGRLGSGPHEEQVLTLEGTPSSEPVVPASWHGRAAKASARILVDGPDDSRIKAVNVLSHLDDPDTAMNLLKRGSYLKTPSHQAMALVAVSGSLDVEHAGLLDPYLESTSPDVKAAATLCLAFTGDVERLDAIEALYFDNAPEVRASAVLATGLLMARTGEGIDAGAREKILTLLRTRQWKVTYQATTLTLAMMGGTESKDQLENFIASRGKIESGKKPPIGIIKKGDSSTLTLRLALIALASGSFEGPDVISSLLDGCWSADPAVREAAGFALMIETRKPGVVHKPVPTHIPVTTSLAQGRFRVTEVLESLSAVPEQIWSLSRIQALRPALTQAIGERLQSHLDAKAMDNKAVGSLLDTLSVLDGDPDHMTWLPFSESLTDAEQDEGRALLMAIVAEHLTMMDEILSHLRGGSASRRDTAVMGMLSVMSKIGGTVVPGSVISLAGSDDEDPSMVMAAIEAIGSFDSSQSVEFLAGLLPGSPWTVRLEIARALSKMHTPEAAQLLDSIAQNDKSEAVKNEAAPPPEA